MSKLLAWLKSNAVKLLVLLGVLAVGFVLVAWLHTGVAVAVFWPNWQYQLVRVAIAVLELSALVLIANLFKVADDEPVVA